MPGLAEVGDSKGERNALLSRSVRNVRISQLYRADYEARNLRRVRKSANRVMREIYVAEAETLPALIRSLDTLIERERILLRIPLPRAVERSAAPSAGPMLEAEPLPSATAEPASTPAKPDADANAS